MLSTRCTNKKAQDLFHTWSPFIRTTRGNKKRKIASKTVNTTDTVCAEVVLDVTGAVNSIIAFNAAMELSHTRAVNEVFQYFDVKENIGLSETQVLQARQTYGLNG